MLTPKENYLTAIKGGKPDWVPVFGEDANMFPPFIWDPDPETMIDFCNVKWVQDEAGLMPDGQNPAMTDITEWRDTIKFPDLSTIDWEKLDEEFHSGDYDPDKVDIAMANTAGIFLVPIDMMGWVDGMCAIIEEPEEYAALVNAVTDFICEYIEYLGKYIRPDIIFSGDDIASSVGPFISKETFDEFFKDNFKRIADKIHEVGALAEFHCCGNCQWVIDEEIDCGYDICQLPVPNDELVEAKKKYGKRLVITGGWERHGEAGMDGAPEEVVRESVRKAIDTYGADGGLIFWDGGIIQNTEENKKKFEWLMDELHTYGKEVYK